MQNVTSAGTLIGAVMETAGYMTQARLLEQFQTYFDHIGGLIYIIAAIGAVISVMLFGSYRAARYLLIGPTFFFFLVSERTPTYGSIYQIGARGPRNFESVTDIKDSAATVQDLVNRTQRKLEDAPPAVNGLPDKPEPREFRVSTFFWWTSRLIDKFVNDATKIILYHKNDFEFFTDRGRALEMLTDPNTSDDQLLNMFSQFFVDCDAMVNASLALSNVELGSAREAELRALIQSSNANGQGEFAARHQRQLDRMLLRRTAYLDDFTKGADRKFLPKEAIGNYIKANRTDLRNDVPQSCQVGWELMTEAIFKNSEKIYRKAERAFLKPLNGKTEEERRIQFCNTLLEKLADNVTGVQPQLFKRVRANGLPDQCQFVVAYTGVFLMRSLFSSRGTGLFLQTHRNHDTFIKPQRGGAIEQVDGGVEALELVGGQANPQFRVQVYDADPTKGGGDVLQYLQGGKRKYARVEAKFRDKKGAESWRPYVRMFSINGHMDSMYKGFASIQLQHIRQFIYTWAMQVPYYQGVMLYLIAVAYPFLAIVVLLPGRAQSILFLPLAWLWIKSWDIGFAMVMLFERMLWNLMEPYALKPGTSGESVLAGTMPTVLGEAFKVDPTFSMFTYYMLVSTALLAIPVLTGAVVLKTKRGLLAMFTGGIQASAKDTAERLEGGAKQVEASNLAQKMKLFQGLALESTSNRSGEGFEAGGRGAMSLRWGLMRAAPSAGTTLLGAASKPAGLAGLLTPSGANLRTALGNTGNTADTVLGTYEKMLGAELSYEQTWRQYYHPRFGRFAERVMSFDANLASLDGGGFEIQDPLNFKEGASGATYGKLQNLFRLQVDTTFDMLADVVKTGSGGLRDAALDPTSLAAWVRATPGLIPLLADTELAKKFIFGDGQLTVAERQALIGALEQLHTLATPDLNPVERKEYLERMFHINDERKQFVEAGSQSTFDGRKIFFDDYQQRDTTPVQFPDLQPGRTQFDGRTTISPSPSIEGDRQRFYVTPESLPYLNKNGEAAPLPGVTPIEQQSRSELPAAELRGRWVGSSNPVGVASLERVAPMIDAMPAGTAMASAGDRRLSDDSSSLGRGADTGIASSSIASASSTPNYAWAASSSWGSTATWATTASAAAAPSTPTPISTPISTTNISETAFATSAPAAASSEPRFTAAAATSASAEPRFTDSAPASAPAPTIARAFDYAPPLGAEASAAASAAKSGSPDGEPAPEPNPLARPAAASATFASASATPTWSSGITDYQTNGFASVTPEGTRGPAPMSAASAAAFEPTPFVSNAFAAMSNGTNGTTANDTAPNGAATNGAAANASAANGVAGNNFATNGTASNGAPTTATPTNGFEPTSFASTGFTPTGFESATRSSTAAAATTTNDSFAATSNPTPTFGWTAADNASAAASAGPAWTTRNDPNWAYASASPMPEQPGPSMAPPSFSSPSNGGFTTPETPPASSGFFASAGTRSEEPLVGRAFEPSFTVASSFSNPEQPNGNSGFARASTDFSDYQAGPFGSSSMVFEPNAPGNGYGPPPGASDAFASRPSSADKREQPEADPLRRFSARTNVANNAVADASDNLPPAPLQRPTQRVTIRSMRST